MRTELQHPSLRRRAYAHPGEALLDEFLTPRALSSGALARASGVPSRHINQIIRGRRRIHTGVAIRLGLALGTSARYWLHLQVECDLAEAQRLLGTSSPDDTASSKPINAGRPERKTSR
jgi:addiction module HigA family antidote